jgi:hypothetical protein
MIMRLSSVIIMIEDQSHGVLEILELGGLHLLDLIIGYSPFLHQRVQLLSCEVLKLQPQTFSYMQ